MQGVMLTVPSQDLAAMLRFTVVATATEMHGPIALKGVHVRVGDDTFTGFGEDWAPGWSGVGVTFAATDRYRMHLAGAPVDHRYAEHGEVLLSRTDVKAALVSAPRKSNDPAGLEWDGGDTAIIRWPRSTFKVAVLTADFPKYRKIIDASMTAEGSEEGCFNGAYFAQAVVAATQFDPKVRVRMKGMRPAVVAPVQRTDRAVGAGAIVMPIRMT